MRKKLDMPMNREKFVRDVFGEISEVHLANVDNVLSTLPEESSMLIKLRYSGLTFTQMGMYIKRKKKRWAMNLTPISPAMASKLFKNAMGEVKFPQYQPVWKGNVVGYNGFRAIHDGGYRTIPVNMKWNWWNRVEQDVY